MARADQCDASLRRQTGYSHPIPKAGIGGSPRFAGRTHGGAAFPVELSLEDELEGQLQQARRARLEYLTERRRFQIVHGQPEIRMVEQVETLRAELHARGFGNLEVFEEREIDVLDPRAAHRVAAFVAKLAGLSLRV